MSSKFCLALPGDGWSARFEDSVLHGCIPVIIMDNVHVPFESILETEKFSVRLAQKDISKLPEILSAIPQSQVDELRVNLHKVWQRFRYVGMKMAELAIEDQLERHKMDQGGRLREDQEGMQYAKSKVDDAFSTIIQWLHSKIPTTRGKPRVNESLYIPPAPSGLKYN
jgi:Exostosin family